MAGMLRALRTLADRWELDPAGEAGGTPVCRRLSRHKP